MAFRMASPYRHPKTGIYWFRKAVPDSLRDVVGKSIVQRTLGTKDRKEAIARFLVVAREMAEHWEALQLPPEKLTTRQRQGVLGEFYKWVVERHTEKPGEPEHWDKRIEDDKRLEKPRNRMSGRRSVVLDDFKKFLEDRKIRLSGSEVFELADKAYDTRQLARRTLERHAAGGYSPDPAAAKFPAYVPQAQPTADAPATAKGTDWLTLADHWDAFVSERQLAMGTQKRWRPLLVKLEEFVGRKNLATVTGEEIGAWKQALLLPGTLSKKTVREGYLASARTFFSWAIDCGKLTTNPCDGITVARDKVIQDAPAEDRDFEPHQCLLILSESLREPDQRMSPRFAAARRWIPWLCAYTGARVNEMTQLRKQDVIEGKVGSETVWQIRITPSAGTVKGGHARDVPMHPHLVEMGFVAFVKGCEDGPLFYDPERKRKGSEFNPPYRKVGDKLARWVREVGIDDRRVDPNHGWRHTFKTVSRDAGLRDMVIDGFAGHAHKTVGQTYGKLTLKVKWEQIKLVPRYEVTAPTGAAPMTEARRRRNEQRVETAVRAKRAA